jgi:hypothetical protein
VVAEDLKKPAKIRHRRFRRLPLWTTLSGFKSLPPSQLTPYKSMRYRPPTMGSGTRGFDHVIGVLLRTPAVLP